MTFKLSTTVALISFLLVLQFFGRSTLTSSEATKDDKEQELNNRPIIGLLFQELNSTTQFVPSSYVKWIEMAGARVVPIFINRPTDYYINLLDQLNGVLIPGGDVDLLTSEYARISDIVYDVAIAKFNAGIHFPVWNTCLGFEKMITYFLGNENINWETPCYVYNLSLPLDFPSGLLTLLHARMLQGSIHIYRLLKKYNVTANFHGICLTVDTFKSSPNLTQSLRLVSTNDYGGVHHVTTLEHVRYPIYGTQWHPEKSMYEWRIDGPDVGRQNHDFNAIQVGQFFANFFINEARRNGQRFGNESDENEALIFNYSNRLVWKVAPWRQINESYYDELYLLPSDY